jgi:CBS domain-containing protein
MKDSRYWLTSLIGLVAAPRALLASDLRAPIIQGSLFILLICGAVLIIGVFFMKRRDRKRAPLISIFEDRPPKLYRMGPDDTVDDCMREMIAHQIGAVVVMEDDRPIGIFTERDILTKVIGGGLEPASTKISEVMSTDPLCVAGTTTVEEAMNIISQRKFRHLPVVEAGNVVGMVSSGDLTRWLVRDKEQEVQQLVDAARPKRRPSV